MTCAGDGRSLPGRPTSHFISPRTPFWPVGAAATLDVNGTDTAHKLAARQHRGVACSSQLAGGTLTRAPSGWYGVIFRAKGGTASRQSCPCPGFSLRLSDGHDARSAPQKVGIPKQGGRVAGRPVWQGGQCGRVASVAGWPVWQGGTGVSPVGCATGCHWLLVHQCVAARQCVAVGWGQLVGGIIAGPLRPSCRDGPTRFPNRSFAYIACVHICGMMTICPSGTGHTPATSCFPC